VPGAGSAPLSTRYAPYVFEQDAVSGGILADEDTSGMNYQFTLDGRKYLPHSTRLPQRRRA
jgi:hypothetical protein